MIYFHIIHEGGVNLNTFNSFWENEVSYDYIGVSETMVVSISVDV